MSYKIKKNNQKNLYMKHQPKNDNEYEKIIITKNMKKSTEKNASISSAGNTIRKNKRHDECHRNQNIM